MPPVTDRSARRCVFFWQLNIALVNKQRDPIVERRPAAPFDCGMNLWLY